MMHNNTAGKPTSPLVSLTLANLFLLIAFIGGLFTVPASAQLTETPQAKTGNILGMLADVNNDPVADAMVVLQSPDGHPLTSVTKDDGTFALRDVPPGNNYQITITADGFAEWTSVLTVEPGQDKTLNDIKLRLLAVQRTVTVGYSSQEVATQQLKAEEQQRVLRFIPNMYVTYDPHPEPLSSKMKFHLAYKNLSNPVFFARAAAWAGVQQAADTPNWQQGAKGYSKRLGAALADATTENLIGNAILPSLLHQDPRYFYQGTDTKKSRALHAMLAPFICKGDNGSWQPNYSTWGGSLISSSISLAYYPSSDRNASHVFKNFGVGIGLHVAGSLAQEFILDKFTSKGKHKTDH